MKTKTNLRRALPITLIIVLLAGLIFSGTAWAKRDCPPTGKETVATDKDHYKFGEKVSITGAGYKNSCNVTVEIIRPDGSSEAAVVTTDSKGKFSTQYFPGTSNGFFSVNVVGKDNVTLASEAFAYGAIVYTDKDDYAPGETVTITGMGWEPWEQVSMLIQEFPEYRPDTTLSALADGEGYFINQDFSPSLDDLGRTFVLTATGQSSGFQAQTQFTDNFGSAVTIASTTVTNATAIEPQRAVWQNPRGQKYFYAIIQRGSSTPAGLNLYKSADGSTWTHVTQLNSATNISASANPYNDGSQLVVYVCYARNDTTVTDPVYYRRLTIADGASDPSIGAEQNTGRFGAHCNIARDRNGYVHIAVWYCPSCSDANRARKSSIFGSTTANPGDAPGWSKQIDVLGAEDVSPSYATPELVVFGGTGNILGFVANRRVASDMQILARDVFSFNGTDFSLSTSTQTISSTAGGAAAYLPFNVVVDNNNVAHVAWQHFRSTSGVAHELRYAKATSAGTVISFGSAMTVDTQTSTTQLTSVALSVDKTVSPNKLYVFYHRDLDSPDQKVRWRSSPVDTISWSSESTFNDGLGVKIDRFQTSRELVDGAIPLIYTTQTGTMLYARFAKFDPHPPAAPTVSSSSPASPANNNGPKIIGSAETGSTVKLYANSACSGSPVATGTAAAFASPGIEVSVGDNTTTTFYATATDAAGNTSACSSTSVTYVEDSSPPAAPTVSSSSPASPANNNSPKIIGSAETGSTVRLYTNSTCTSAVAATGTAAAFASPGLEVTVSDNTTTTFYATATDAAGNTSACSSTSVTYVEDSSPPTAPTVSLSDPASPANNNSPKIIGSAETGSTVKLYANSACSGSPVATGTAAAFASPGIEVSVGDNTTTTLYATATDAAGNTSPCSTSFVTYVEDSAAPTITLTSPVNGGVVNGRPTFNGVAGTATGDSTTVTVKVYSGTGTGGTLVRTLTTTRDLTTGAYSVTNTNTLPTGTYTARAEQTDSANNIGYSNTRTFTVSTR